MKTCTNRCTTFRVCFEILITYFLPLVKPIKSRVAFKVRNSGEKDQERSKEWFVPGHLGVEVHNWLHEKGHSDICVKCRLGPACAIREG